MLNGITDKYHIERGGDIVNHNVHVACSCGTDCYKGRMNTRYCATGLLIDFLTVVTLWSINIVIHKCI